MPQSKQRRRKGHGEVIPPLTVLQRVSALLKEHLSIFPSKPDLTEEEIEHWHQDLKGYPLEAIEYAFDSWRRNGRFFPVYAEILELCRTWNPPDQITTLRCSEECLAKHGKGYNVNDVLKLWVLYGKKFTELGRKLSADEWEDLLIEVDKWRGGPPAWRIAA